MRGQISRVAQLFSWFQRCRWHVGLKRAVRTALASLLTSSIPSILSISTAECATESVLYSFQNNGADGLEPYAGVIAVKAILYGTTGVGGSGTCTRIPPYGCGTVFALDPVTGAETILYSFQNNGEDGTAPNSRVRTQ